MPKPKPKKVFTPGSGPNKRSPGAGRPRKVQEKHKKKFKRLLYPQDKLEEAIKMVRENTMTLGEASRHFDIPKTTIYDRLDGYAS
jgi:transposase